LTGSVPAGETGIARGISGDELVLSNDQLGVVVLPSKGCDILSVVDQATGIDVLFKTPWSKSVIPSGVIGGDSTLTWLSQYRGGWQLLCPNAGSPREANGTTRGYHGEAALLPWRVLHHSSLEARFEVDLFSVPVAIGRRISLEGATLRVEESLTNTSEVALDVVWMHHPAFAPPLLGRGSRLVLDAAQVYVEHVRGAELPAVSTSHAWPVATRGDGGEVNLEMLADTARRGSMLAYLTDFCSGRARIESPATGLDVELRWPVEIFPYAWLWYEMAGSDGFPWYQRARVLAIEPTSTIPGEGEIAGHPRGTGVELGPGERRTASLELVVSARA